jgi:hypothetical protein
MSPRSKPTETEKYLIERTRSGAFILVCSGNGFERERALEGVRELPNGFCLALTIVRLNDWVDEVRTAARSALLRHAATLDTDVLLQCFELYLASSDWGRMNVADRVACDDLFRRRVSSESLIAAIISSRDDQWLRSMSRMLRRADWDTELLRIANTARHWGVRFKAIQALLRGEHQWADRGRRRRPLSVAIDREALIRQGLEDSSPSIRLTALRAYAETLDIPNEVSRPRFEQLVLDKSAKVVSTAAFWLSRVGGDPAGVLRKHVMSTEPIVPAALSILGTFGKPEDHRALLQVATAHSGRTRWAALSSATQLARSAVLPQIKEIAVGDDTAEATRAVRLLVELGEGLAFEELSLWAKKPEQFADRRYLDLTHKLVPWRALAIILTLPGKPFPIATISPLGDRTQQLEFSPCPCHPAHPWLVLLACFLTPRGKREYLCLSP